MKKSIIIIGPPRSGKSTLAQRLVKELRGYSMIGADNFPASYIGTCRRLGIKDINLAVPIAMSFDFLKQCMYYENSINYIFESKEYDEEMIEKNKDKFIIVFLGYPKLTEKELFNNIRKYDKKNDWTYIEPNWRLKLHCEFFVKDSKEKSEIAKKHNYWYIDTSYNREHVLNDTVDKIKALLQQED